MPKKKYFTEEERKEARYLSQKKYCESNPNRRKQTQDEYYKNNLDKAKNAVNRWAKNNPDKIKKSQKKYSKKPESKIKANERQNKRHKEKPYLSAWRVVLKCSLLRMGNKKEGHTIDLLEYSALDLKNHITSLFTDGMSWDNYGKWHIDHIKRVCEFDKDTHPRVVNALSNLRPLWATTREINGVIYEGNQNRKNNY